ncbi:hypothetical protein DVH05_001398 [Phytophthora capsici]|nr:hypothetical protein DVH05_001398 [Phytophthora capsici]
MIQQPAIDCARATTAVEDAKAAAVQFSSTGDHQLAGPKPTKKKRSLSKSPARRSKSPARSSKSPPRMASFASPVRTSVSQSAAPESPKVIDLSGNDDDDVNTYDDDERNYQMLDSGDESEEGDLNDLDGSNSEDSDMNTIDEDDDEAFAAEEHYFADHFMQEMGGEERVLAGEILGLALKEISSTCTGWHDTVMPNVEEFLQTPYVPVSGDDEYPNLLHDYRPTEAALKRDSYFSFSSCQCQCDSTFLSAAISTCMSNWTNWWMSIFKRKKDESAKPRQLENL